MATVQGPGRYYEHEHEQEPFCSLVPGFMDDSRWANLELRHVNEYLFQDFPAPLRR